MGGLQAPMLSDKTQVYPWTSRHRHKAVLASEEESVIGKDPREGEIWAGMATGDVMLPVQREREKERERRVRGRKIKAREGEGGR